MLNTRSLLILAGLFVLVMSNRARAVTVAVHAQTGEVLTQGPGGQWIDASGQAVPVDQVATVTAQTEPPALADPVGNSVDIGAGLPQWSTVDENGDMMPNIDATLPDSPETADANVRAFLQALRFSEGTATQDDTGYRVLFGWPRIPGRTFDSYADHPRRMFSWQDNSGKTILTSAAGAYQITRSTFDDLRAKYPQFANADFSPATQDAMAVQLIARRGALADVQAGRFRDAVAKLVNEWASLPGPYNAQPQRPFASVLAAYQAAGGALA